MARKRQLDPDLWTNVQFMSLSMQARLLFIGLITQADDEGRLRGHPRYLRAAIFPNDNIKVERILAWRSKLVDTGLIRIYTNGEGPEEYIVLPTFKKWQYMTKRFPSKLPSPPQVNNRLITDTQQGEDTLHGIGDGGGVGNGNGNGVSTSAEGETEKVFQAYEKNIGLLTPIVAEQIGSAVEHYPQAWIIDAIAEAVKQNKRSWAYIEAILKRWESEGRNDGKARQSTRGIPGNRPTGAFGDLAERDKDL